MKQLTELLKERKEKGMAIAKTEKISEQNGVWLVPSASNPHKVYQVVLTINGGRCNCEDFEERSLKCKHQFAVWISLTRTTKKSKNGTITETTTKKVVYTQNWKAYTQASIHQKELMQKLLNDLCNTIEEKPYTFGRPRLPMRDMVFASALKVYTTFSLRRFGSDSKEAQAKGYLVKVPDYSTVAKYMESAFFMIKSKFSDYVRSKTDTACINEILLKLICHNLCVVIQETFELGIQANFQ